MRLFKLAKSAARIAKVVVTNKPRTVVAKQIALEAQELGPLYVKVGQFVSSRKDLFGEDVTQEFAFLRDSIVPVDKDLVKQMIAKANLTQVSDVDYNPIASASIGQVHIGRLTKNNRKVILKLRRPNIEKEVKEQLDLLKKIVSIMDHFKVENSQETKKLLMDFEQVILDEMNFSKEMESLRNFYQLYKGDSKVIIPKLYEELSSPDIIVMDFVDSVCISEYNSNEKRKLARAIMELFVDQLLYYGIMHGDPHLGNIRLTKDNSLVLYDFGNVLLLSDTERHQLKELVCQLVIGNTNGVMNTMKRIGIRIEDEKVAREYIAKYMEYMKTIDINTFRTSNLMEGGNVKIPMRINNTIMRIIRIFGMVEGTCKQLDPTFNYFDLLESYIDSIFMDDEFLLYKINTDIGLLFDNILHLTTNDLKEIK